MVWEKLATALISQLALKMSSKDLPLRCVKTILDEKGSGSVSINDFNDFLQWFGPLTRNTVNEVYSLLREPFVLSLSYLFLFLSFPFLSFRLAIKCVDMREEEN